MEKLAIYNLNNAEQGSLISYISTLKYSVSETDAVGSKTIYDRQNIPVGTIIGPGSFNMPNVQTSNRDLEKILDEFMGRDSNPSDLPRTSSSGA